MIKQIVSMTLLTFSASVLAGSIVSSDANADVFLIGNSEMKVESVSEREAKGIWLGKRNQVSTGEDVSVADQASGSESRSEFYRTVIGKGPRQMKAYWAKRVFTGKGNPPPELKGDAAVIDWVAKTLGGMGYVGNAEPGDSVKVLMQKQGGSDNNE